MAIKIRKHIVPTSVANNVTYGGTNGKKYITIHETDNVRQGANADAHARLQANGNSRNASWHYTVDDKEIVQSFSDNAQCWAGGDGRGNGNTNSIHIEICVNNDGNYKKAVANAVKLTKHLRSKYGISANNVVQHNRWSGKNCPRNLRNGGKGVSWAQFKQDIGGTFTSKPSQVKPSKPSVKPVKTNTSKSTSKANLTVDGKWGKDVTRALQRSLKTPVDGIISGQPRNSVSQSLYSGTVSFGNGGSPMIKALQRKVGAGVDGKLGPDTVRKLQAYLGTPQDSVLSRPSMVIKELQRRLNAGTF